LLREDGSRGEVGAVSFDVEEFRILRRHQDWSGGHRCFETFEGFLFLSIPVPSLVGTSEVEEGPGDGGEVPDEATVEVDEAYESLYVSPVLWGGLIVDSSNLNRVHLDLVLRDDQSEVLNPLPIELTLLQVEE